MPDADERVQLLRVHKEKMSNATSASVPDQTAALLANVVQAGVFVFLGPFICTFGPAIIHISMLIRSLFAMNYLSFINSVSAVNRMTAFSVFTDQLAVLSVGTLSMTIASLKAARLRAYTSGAVLGTMIATPLVALVRQTLYFSYVGCTAYGEKTAMFPDGVPIGCSQDSNEFQLTFQGTKALTVAIVAGMALLGTKTMGFSIAMMGATMIMSGGLDLTKTILLQVASDPSTAVQVETTMAALQMPITYAIAGFGYLTQWMILKPKRDDRYPDPYLLDPNCDTPKDAQMKEELAKIKPYEQVGFIPFFKAVRGRPYSSPTPLSSPLSSPLSNSTACLLACPPACLSCLSCLLACRSSRSRCSSARSRRRGGRVIARRRRRP